MLTSKEALRKVWQRQQAEATSPVDDPPEEEESLIAEENEVRIKTYLRALQAQDISPVESESEDAVESKMRLEDIEDVVDRARTVNARIQFISAAGGEQYRQRHRTRRKLVKKETIKS